VGWNVEVELYVPALKGCTVVKAYKGKSEITVSHENEREEEEKRRKGGKEECGCEWEVCLWKS
jgi:hypothetical protein